MAARRKDRSQESDEGDDGEPAYDFYDDWEEEEEEDFNRPIMFTSSSKNQQPAAHSTTPEPTFVESATTATANNNPQNSHFFSRKSLEDPTFQISLEFKNLCLGAGITRPSKIQSLAWPQLLDGKHAIVADQTGSGKTLAYLIPLLQRALSQPKIKAPGTPRVLILSPTAELADQTRAVCQKLGEQANFKTMVVTANGQYATSIRDQIRLLQRTSIDVLISTPGRLATVLRTKNSGLNLGQLSAIVLDEVDVLLVDETFGPQLRAVGAAAPVDQTQFVFVTATLPNSIVEQVEREFPGVVKVKGPGLHRVAPTVNERLVDVSVPPQYNRDAEYCFDIKAQQLLKALRETRCRRTLIFCNTVENCRRVENLLKRSDRRGQVLEVISYHNALTPEARNENLAIFSKGRQQPNRSNDKYDPIRGNNKKRESGEKADYVLVCTDRAARGVDFDAAPVDHVVIFDFPKDPAEYVRRVGRTARAGRGGTSTVFAFGWQLPIARKVMGKTLKNLNADDEDEEGFGKGNGEEYGGRTRGKNREDRVVKQTKDSMVKGNIEEKRLWR